MFRTVALYAANAVSYALTGAAMLATAVVLRLTWGPIQLPGVAKDVEQQVNAELDGWRMSVGGVGIDVAGGEYGYGVSFSDVSLFDDLGRQVASAPQAIISVDREAGFGEDMRITRIELVGVEAVAHRAQNGEISLSVRKPGASAALELPVETGSATTENASDGEDASERFLAALTGEGAPPALADLSEIRVRESAVVFEDDLAGRRWSFSSVEAGLVRGAEGYALGLSGALQLTNDGEPIPAVLQAALPLDDTRADLVLSIPGVSIEGLVEQDPALAPFAPLSGVLIGEGALQIDVVNGAISPIEGSLRLSDGALKLDGSAAAPIKRLQTRFLVDPAGEAVRLSEILLEADSVTLKGDAAIDVVRGAAGSAEEISVRVLAESGRFDTPRHLLAPMPLERGALDFDYAVGAESITVRGFEATLGGVELSGAGKAVLGATVDDTDFWIEAKIGGFDVADLPRLWPLTISKDGRAWIVENISGGRITGVDLAYRSGGSSGEEDLRLEFGFEELVGTPMQGMPPITNADGSGVVVLDRLDLELTAGQSAMEGRGPMLLAGSQFAITSFEPDIPPSETTVRATGDIQDLFAMLDAEPLKLISAWGRDMSGLSGQVEATASMAFPLAKDLPIEDVQIESEGKVRNLVASLKELDEPITSDELNVRATVEGLAIEGAVRVGGMDLDVAVRESFKEGVEGELALSADLNSKELDQIAGLGRFVTRGFVRLSATMPLEKTTAPIPVRLEARNASLALPAIGWTKPRGRKASAEALVTFDDGVRVDRIDAKLGDMRAKGDMRFDKGGKLAVLEFDEVTIGKRSAFSLSAKPDGKGRLALRGRGKRLDASGLLEGAGATKAVDGPAPPLTMDFAFDTVYVAAKGKMTNVKLKGARSKDGIVEADFSARTRSARVRGELSRADNGGQGFFLTTDDAGLTLREMGLYRGGRGGRLAVFGVAKGQRAAGELRARDIVLTDAPALAELFSVATVIGIFDKIGTGGTSFSRVRVPFVMSAKHLDIRDAAASGPSLGLAFSGRLNREKETINLKGTLAPLNFIQGAIDNIPLVGDIFGKFVAVSFSLSGPVSNPKASANPLTVLTPGPLKAIVGGSGFDVEGERERPRRKPREGFDD